MELVAASWFAGSENIALPNFIEALYRFAPVRLQGEVRVELISPIIAAIDHG
jgi:hypothetical protein